MPAENLIKKAIFLFILQILYIQVEVKVQRAFDLLQNSWYWVILCIPIYQNLINFDVRVEELNEEVKFLRAGELVHVLIYS